MKREFMTIFCLGSLVLVSCSHEPVNKASQNLIKPQQQSIEVIEIPRQILTFQPTRADISVGKVTFTIAASKPESVRVNGHALDPAWLQIELKNIARNQYELAPLNIEWPQNPGHEILCMSVKAWFQEVSTTYDSLFYQNTEDRYALISWCSMAPESFPTTQYKSRFAQNRVMTVNEFKEALTKPFVIKLNDRPLDEEKPR